MVEHNNNNNNNNEDISSTGTGNNTHNNNKPKDKSSLVILAIVIVFVISAAILAMGAVPELFRQSALLNQTLVEQEQDEKVRNQSRALLASVTNETNEIVREHHQNLIDFMHRENNTTNKLFDEIDNNTAQNAMILSKLDTRGQDHDRMSSDLDNVSKEIDNTTHATFDLLERADDRNFAVNTRNEEKLDAIMDYFNITDKKIN